MRSCKSALLCLSVMLCVLSAPRFLHAQFQDPTPDELKMTSDPQAPGAAAVYLYREETTDDNLHYHSYYVRIKVLTEKGKEMATVHIPYEHGSFKVTDVHGRTIHSDGTIVPLVAKPEDLVDTKSASYQVNTMVFTLPSVEVGSILEYRLQLRYDDNIVSSPTWQIMQPYFVHKSHYMFAPAKTSSHYITDHSGKLLNNLLYSVIGFPADKVRHDMTGRFTIDLTDTPAQPHEDWMPPMNTVSWRVEFYYSFAYSGKEYWDAVGKKWLKDTNHFMDANDQMKAAVSQIVAPADTPEQMARKIYAAVMKLENTDFTRKKSKEELKSEKLKESKNTNDVWNQKSGTSDELAMLYVALARAAGLKAWPAQVVNRDRAIFDVNFLSTWQLDDYIAIVELDGKEVYLDPGQKMCAYGQLHWKHNFTQGLRQAASGIGFVTTPINPYTSAITKNTVSVDVTSEGNISGSAYVVMTGPEALRWRQIALRNDSEEVKKQFNEQLHGIIPDGAQADLDHFIGMDNGEANLVAAIKVSGNLGTITGKHVFLPSLFFQSRSKHPFVSQEKREAPIDMQYPQANQEEDTYRLPKEFVAEGLPTPAQQKWEGNAIFNIASARKENSVVVARFLAYNFVMLPASNYPALRDFFQKVSTADQQQVTLTLSDAAKGN